MGADCARAGFADPGGNLRDSKHRAVGAGRAPRLACGMQKEKEIKSVADPKDASFLNFSGPLQRNSTFYLPVNSSKSFIDLKTLSSQTNIF